MVKLLYDVAWEVAAWVLWKCYVLGGDYTSSGVLTYVVWSMIWERFRSMYFWHSCTVELYN